MKGGDEIVRFYRNLPDFKKKKFKLVAQIPDRPVCVTNFNPGLGDAISVCSIPTVSQAQSSLIPCHSVSPHFRVILDYMEANYAQKYSELKLNEFNHINVCALVDSTDCGNGHFIQQIQRAAGLSPEKKPSGLLTQQKEQSIKKKKVVLSFGAGAVTSLQKATIHPRAREFYPEHRYTVQKFIRNHSDYDFVEIGTRFSGLSGVTDATSTDLRIAIEHLLTADFHLGIHSGITNLAAALGVKSIVMINFPDAHEVRLPQLINSNITDIHWLYPQNVHLHMDYTDDTICPFFCYDSLCRAFHGDIYPYFEESSLDLIYDF